MAGYAVDGERQVMLATGIVGESKVWVQKSDGKWSSTEDQARDDAEGGTGLRLWEVEVFYTSTSWGRTSTVTAMVTVPSRECPKVEALKPIVFDG
ncbi:MAG: hypothetical protein ACRCYU_08695, partial [Nocardioides sp.]